MKGRDRLPGNANYFLGDKLSLVGVPTFRRVVYEDVYAGVDLAYYGNAGRLEYDFVLRPRVDPSILALRFHGSRAMKLKTNGDLVLELGAGSVVASRPIAYQDVGGVRRTIPSWYVLRGRDSVGFRLGAYDETRPLVIDPVLFYSTFLGGSGSDQGLHIAVDAVGNAYVTGGTASVDFPTSAAFQTTLNGPSDAFVTKLNPTGSGLVYSTYLGGSDDDTGFGVAIDPAGDAFVGGFTGSMNFPTTPGAFQTTPAGQLDAFVTKLSPSGSALVYSTYIGGSSTDLGHRVALDGAGDATIAGVTISGNFPTTPLAFQPAPAGDFDGFVTKLNATGSALVYSTYLGGSGFDNAVGLASDAGGTVVATGSTASTNFPTTPGAFQTAPGGNFDGFVTELNASGSTAIYSTYLGGAADDEGLGVRMDAAGNAYVTGDTDSGNFPTTAGAFQTTLGGPKDAFATKLAATGSTLLYSTYLGGSGSDGAFDLAVDPAGNAYMTGQTASSNFPTTAGAFQPALAGSVDAFVTKLAATGSSLVYSSYLGGSSANDEGHGIGLDGLPMPNAYVAGFTASVDFPTTPGAFQTTFGGGVQDAFVSKITDILLPPPPTVGKATGGGSIDVLGGIGTFGFIVQRQTTTGPISGQLQYVNHALGEVVHSVEITSLVIGANTATFGGTCVRNGSPCTFTVNVADNGEPGVNDTFTISVSGGPTEGGLLRSGDIQVHQ